MEIIWIALAVICLVNAALPYVVVERFFDWRYRGYVFGPRVNLVPLARVALVVAGELLLGYNAGLTCSLWINGIALVLAQGDELLNSLLEWIIGPIRF